MTDTPSKPKGRGRPRLTAEDVQARVDAYCARYGVTPNPDGLPPYPAGQRETPQHREWLAVYKARKRLARHVSVPTELAALLESQKGRCVICDDKLELADVVPHTHGDARAALHARCSRLVGMAEAVGLDGVDRLRAYLWPDRMGAGRE